MIMFNIFNIQIQIQIQIQGNAGWYGIVFKLY